MNPDAGDKQSIVVIGAGRMGRGIAHVFAYAGHPVTVVDLKQRAAPDFDRLGADVRREIADNLRLLASLGVMTEYQVQGALGLIDIRPAAEAAEVLAHAQLILEAVPETRVAKRQVLAEVGRLAPRDTVVTSTTSSMLVTELQEYICGPERFLNTHFLNPAYLIPLVEVSPGPATSEGVVTQVMQLFEAVGKVPVRCAASPGYIVPRLQALLMSEACRMVHEGVATAEGLDKAVTCGFGPRYATMGLLEFIDWGGVDILYYGGNYLAEALNSPRHAPPPEVGDMIKEGRKGMREGRGYYDYRGMDMEAYQREKLSRLVNLLKNLGRVPRPGLPES